MNQIILYDERVQTIFQDCLATDEDPADARIEIEGVAHRATFSKQRVEEWREIIGLLLGELPDQFKASGGGGSSLLNACDDKHGRQWTGLHKRVEELFMLGMAVDKVRELLPSEMRSALPGGVPYYVVSVP